MRDGGDADFEVEALQCHGCEAKRLNRVGWKGDNLEAIYFGVTDTNPPD